jgi:hypothetical protein
LHYGSGVFCIHALVGCGWLLTPLMLVEGLNRKLGISNRLFALVDSALLSSVGQVGAALLCLLLFFVFGAAQLW